MQVPASPVPKRDTINMKVVPAGERKTGRPCGRNYQCPGESFHRVLAVLCVPASCDYSS